MTLATRCTACGTSFRVVQDQLKVSGGWVRCGRCNEIFNAIEGLYEIGSPLAGAERRATVPTPIEAATPTAASPPPAAPAPVPAPATASALAPAPAAAAAPAPTPASADVPPSVSAPTAQAETAISSEPTAEPAPAVPAAHAPPADDLAWDDDARETVVPDLPPASTLNAGDSILLEPSPADDWRPEDSPERAPTPSFLVAAARAERTRHPVARRTLGVAALLLAVLLAAQAALAYRDVVAARWPALRTPLESVCAVLGCTVEPLRFIAALSVEASSLQQIGSEPVYALQIALRNRSDTELLAPAIDLVLTDTQGRPIARRILTLAELGRPSRVLPAGSEVSAQATIATGPQRVAGYTIEIFYP